MNIQFTVARNASVCVFTGSFQDTTDRPGHNEQVLPSGYPLYELTHD